MTASPFALRVTQGLERKGLTLRGLCRAARLDPSFFSKVLSGKRSPPMEEDVLRRIAEILGLDAAELVVSAGRIPEEWRALRSNSELFRRMDALATERHGEEVPLPESAGTRPTERHGEEVPPPTQKRFKRQEVRNDIEYYRAKPDLAEELL
jgi:transcriptional regulator with XRE-family HTH domain